MSTTRRLLFLASAAPLAALEFCVLLAGWLTTALLAVTPAVVPVLVGFRWTVGALAQVEAALARTLLGIELTTPRTPRGRGFWGSGRAVVADAAFWRQQVYLALRTTLGFGLAVGELSLIGAAGYLIFLPIYWQWVDQWHVHSVGEAFLAVPVGIAVLVAALLLTVPLAALWRALAATLLGERGRPTPETRRRALVWHAAAFAAVGVVLTIIWATTRRGYFWPEWALLALALPLAMHAWTELLDARPQLARPSRAVALHAGLSAAILLFLVATWAFTGAGYPWPLWPLLGLGTALGVHVLVERRGRLTERIEQLETSRAGAVDVQETDLRRIERDLHDGAQARLVALGMSLGLAEQKLDGDPEAARELVADARVGVEAALRELRDLARGIHPPVLTDRGLGAAIAALADASAVPVSVDVSVPERPAPAVETAAYFVVAEGLANAAKHAQATEVAIRITCEGDRLVLQVTDDGVGGAQPEGAGLSGLRRRVDALDGTLRVTSPAGGPTVLRAELPCGS